MAGTSGSGKDYHLVNYLDDFFVIVPERFHNKCVNSLLERMARDVNSLAIFAFSEKGSVAKRNFRFRSKLILSEYQVRICQFFAFRFRSSKF